MSGVLHQLKSSNITHQLLRQTARFRSPVAIGAFIVAFGMLLGRVSGLMREMALAKVYGISRSADLAIFAMTLPDLLTNLLLGGAIGAVLIPHYYQTVHQHGDAAGRVLLGHVFLIMGGAGLLIAGLMLTTLWVWVPILGPGFEGRDLVLAKRLASIAILAFPLSAMSAVVTAGLQVSNRMIAVVGGTLIVNVTVIFVLLLAVRHQEQVVWAAIAIVLACLARLVLGWIMCDIISWRHLFSKSNTKLVSPSTIVSYVRALAGIGFVVCFPVVARAIATKSPGDSATLNYALKLVEVPVGIVTAIIGLVVLPRLSSCWHAGRKIETRDLLLKSIVVGCGSMCCFAMIFPSVASHFVELLFGGNEMDIENLARITKLSEVLVWSAPPSVAVAVLTAYCHAKQDTWSPMIASGVAIVTFFPLAHAIYGSHGLVGLARVIPLTFLALSVALTIVSIVVSKIKHRHLTLEH